MRALLVGSLLLFVACGSDDPATKPAAVDAGSAPSPAPLPEGAPVDAGVDAAVDPCAGALFCETFESYPTITTIADKQKLGPWRAALSATGATMALDGTHRTSGGSALHVHVDDAKTAGGRLFAEGTQPIFEGAPKHLYGRLMMYVDPNGTSTHWTFFGVNGTNTDTNRAASYILSSLPVKNANAYAFVYGLAGIPTNAFHDCYEHGETPMPTAAWSCVSFELDSTTRKLRMYKDGAADPIVSVDDRGQGCVAPTPGTSTWDGPSVTQLYAGAWSFHEMKGPLDVWIDDVVVDTKPVSCASN